ncbi:allantoin permease [Cutibacterium sp. WCA-380-WT-3A]|uniref:Allantoin permease n=1 Tax=Cutibacterium porci TaxID=2605781 RepID=A0A7K0J9N0_9ACTN|nr:cytosine permease [Cutibacterium porci]MSS46679.1 allantoin permease [Cutibacterium porci]
MTQTATEPSTEPRAGIETTGIEIVEESQRIARPRDLFLPWFASNVSVFGMSYGAFILGFGVSFWQAIAATLIGVIISFGFCGIIAIAGKRGSAPTMVLSRAAFGTQGNKIPGIISWMTSIGWETSLAITAVLATTTIFHRLGWSSGNSVKVCATVVVAFLIIGGAVAGYHIIMKLQAFLTWITGILTVIYLAMAVSHINWHAATSLPSASFPGFIGALTLIMTGTGLGWTNIAADWSRYQSRTSPGFAIAFWNVFGASLPLIILITGGLLLAASSKDLSDAIGADPIGALATILPTWFLIPFLLAAILSLLAGAINGIYSSGLTLLTLGIRIPRPAASLIDGAILTAGTLYVVFVAPNFISPFQSFLVTLGVPLSAWTGIMMADITLRRRPYDEADLFDGSGRYGRFDVTSITIFIIVTVIGWGLVINTYEGVSWNNWQGYLLGVLGLGGREGDWAYANLGVLGALFLGYIATIIIRRGTVRRQESR